METRDNQEIVFNQYDNETRKYVVFMCKKGCKFYDNKKGCTKERVVRECARKGFKNKE